MSDSDLADEPGTIEVARDPAADQVASAEASDDDGLVVDTKETALAAALAAVSGAENEFAKLLAVRNGVEGLVRLDYGAAIDEFAAACISECGMSFTVVQAAVERGKNHAELPQDAPPDPKPSVIDIGPSPEIVKLAKLTPMEYERTRRSHADRLGMRASVLDDFVKALRPKAGGKEAGAVDEDAGFSEPHWDITPSPEKVSLDQLLDDITAVIDRYMVMDACAVDALALWVLNTYAHGVFDVAPYAHVFSPVPGCGKSRVMTLTQYMGYRTSTVLDPSAASIFRTIEAAHPVLLLDEVDRFINQKDNDLIGILNAGYKRSGFVLRMEEVDGKHVPRKFSTFGPKMLAGIGKLPRTLAERSIRLPLQKKKKGEKPTRLRDRDTPEFKGIRSRALRWVNDNRARLEEIRDRDEVQFPDALGDREGETWEPLLAIALLVGRSWQERALQAAVAASGASAVDDEEYGTRLLGHIREVFDAEGKNLVGMPGKIILQRLNDNEEWPWREHGKGGKPMTLPAMQAVLKGFNIHTEPNSIEIKSFADRYGKVRGYLRNRFEDAWEKYCKPASDTAPPLAPPLPPSSCWGDGGNADGSTVSSYFQGVGKHSAPTPQKREEVPVNSMFPPSPQHEDGGRGGAKGANPEIEPVCEFCGQPGTLLDVYADGHAARLHEHCIEAWDNMVVVE
jgi:Protein of unknown function (DUF3631)